MHKCLLCGSETGLLDIYQNERAQKFWKCQDCGFIFRSPEHHMTLEEQKSRYQFHQNDIHDQAYQNFLRPIVDAVLKSHGPDDLGLDFGCGPASVVAHLLKENFYKVSEYDPIFKPEQKLLEPTYDYITCTEVVEHLTQPRREFALLRELLKEKGRLYIKTALTDDVVDFARWYYHRDHTHVGFYNQSSFEYVRNEFNYSSLEFENGLIVLAR